MPGIGRIHDQHRRTAASRRTRVRAAIFVVHAVALLGRGLPAQRDDFAQLARLARCGPAHEMPAGGQLGLSQALRDARNDRRVAIVASHPDDQYLLPATFLRINEGYRVSVILMTRGEGGQNSEGPETGDALARLRTIETETCARRLGLEVEYVNLPDAGYSRSGRETLDLWGREESTDALAAALRRVRPDLVLTTHHPGETHGHDLALLAVLPDSIERAGDPSVGLGGLEPVAIDRLYRGAGPGEDAWFALATDDVDPDHGETYRTLAYQALKAAHRSQAPFRPIDSFFESANQFVGVPFGAGRSAAPPVELYDELPDLFASLRGSISASQIAGLQERFDVTLPPLVTNRPRLADEALALRDELLALDLPAGSPGDARRARRIEALERVALHAAGIRAEVLTRSDVAVPGERLRIQVAISSSGFFPLRSLDLASARVGQPEPRVESDANLARPQPWLVTAELDVPQGALADDPLLDLFRKRRFRMPLAVSLQIGFARADGSTTVLALPLEIPIAVRPAIELQVHPKILLVANGESTVRFNVRIRRHSQAPLRDRLRVQLPPGFDVEPPFVQLDLRTEPVHGYLFRLEVPTGMRPGPQPIRVRVGDASARVELHRVPMDFPGGIRVGLVEGVDDAARTVLSQLDCELIVLGEATLPTRPLDDLDTILVDIRALRQNLAARAEFNRLLAYAANGGRLVILYHKDAEFDPELTGQRFHPASLPLRIGKGRVTREDAPITLRLPNHPLLNSPNRLQTDDWDGWTQERGLYFASAWSDEYQTPLRLADPGEPPEDGSLLYARTGRGEYIYCALALHRQLKNLHPGACRLFANLIAHRRGDR